MQSLLLDQFLPYRLSVLSNAISRRMSAIYAQEFDLSIWQWRIIAVLGEYGDLTSTQLAQRTQTDKPTVSRATTQLQVRGLITRSIDAADRRRAPIRLTPDGQQIYKNVAPQILALEADLLTALNAEEIAILHRLLGQLAKATSPDMPLWQDKSI